MATARVCNLLLVCFWAGCLAASPDEDLVHTCPDATGACRSKRFSRRIDDETSLLQVAVKQHSRLSTRVEDPGSEDRYPPIFIDLHNLFSSLEDPDGHPEDHREASRHSLKFLSFGCGSGQEVRALRKYFPNALVDGVDADSQVIRENMKNNSDPLMRYFDSTNELERGTYDGVLAMSVLCSQNEQDHLPYDTFNKSMRLLDELVRPNGYLVVYNANYPFYEFDGADRYEPIADSCNIANENVVEKLDQRGSASPHSWNRGWCTHFGKFCHESGWRAKYDRKGSQVQPEQPDPSMSFGCLHPGTIFKKVKLASETSKQPVKLVSGKFKASKSRRKDQSKFSDAKSVESEEHKSEEHKSAEASTKVMEPTIEENSADDESDSLLSGSSEKASILTAPKVDKQKQMVTVIYSNMK